MRDGAEVISLHILGLGHESLEQRHLFLVRSTLGVWEVGGCGGAIVGGGECHCVLTPGLHRSCSYIANFLAHCQFKKMR